MKKSISKTLELKKLSKKKLNNLYGGDGDGGGLKLNNGSTTTCREELEDKNLIEYSLLTVNKL